MIDKLFDKGCRWVRVERSPDLNKPGEYHWKYQVFTDKNIECASPARTIKEAVKLTLERIAQLSS